MSDRAERICKLKTLRNSRALRRRGGCAHCNRSRCRGRGRGGGEHFLGFRTWQEQQERDRRFAERAARWKREAEREQARLKEERARRARLVAALYQRHAATLLQRFQGSLTPAEAAALNRIIKKKSALREPDKTRIIEVEEQALAADRTGRAQRERGVMTDRAAITADCDHGRSFATICGRGR